MSTNFYGCVPILAWILSHYFYADEHFVWLASEYYPYRLPNPKSSNPHLIYQDLYQPWKDKDDFDKFLQQMRLNLRKGVIAKEASAVITSGQATRLKDICDNVDIVFFYPIIYKVDIDLIPPARRHVSGSGAKVGSSEYLVKDLVGGKPEFELIFLDFNSDPDFQKIVLDEYGKTVSNTAFQVMNILEARC